MARKFIKRLSKKIGLPPGSLVHIGEKKVEKVKISVIDYEQEYYDDKEIESLDDIVPFRDSSSVSWININGLHDVDKIKIIGTLFDIHPLVIEDILNTDQRPKIEMFDDYIFIVIKMIYYGVSKEQIFIEHVSCILGKNYVLTFQEQEGDIFNIIRDRIKNGKGRMRKSGTDYLTYALMDVVIDNYFLVLENLNDKIESLEDKLVLDPDRTFIQDIQYLKREMIFLRKSIWPLRELISNLIREENPLIDRSTEPYLRDLYDHTIQVIDTVESFRDVLGGMLDIYLSSISNKMNEVMKVLTVIATIFIPLTFLAGIYGMNFEFMPELKCKWAYPAFWGVILLTFSGLFIYFKKKKWV
jgi:magnesium transporter